MGRRVWSFLLAVLVVLGSGEAPALAQAKEEALRARSAKVREAIARVGVGEGTRVDVALIDKSFHSGYVCEADDDSFVVVNPAIDTRVRVGYDEVKRLRTENSATGVKVSIPGERPKVLRAAMRVATFGIAGRVRVETSSNSYLSKPAIVVLAVPAVGLILIGVELGKS